MKPKTKKEMKEIIYPEKPKINKGYVGGGISERKYYPVYRFYFKNGFREKSVDYGRGYLDALRDVKKLNKE